MVHSSLVVKICDFLIPLPLSVSRVFGVGAAASVVGAAAAVVGTVLGTDTVTVLAGLAAAAGRVKTVLLLTAAMIAPPPQHSTTTPAMMPMIRPVRDFFFAGTGCTGPANCGYGGPACGCWGGVGG